MAEGYPHRFEPVAYRVEAIPHSTGGISTACVMSCEVTGKMLSGSGGGGRFISPEVMDLLLNDEATREFIKNRLDAAPVA